MRITITYRFVATSLKSFNDTRVSLFEIKHNASSTRDTIDLIHEKWEEYKPVPASLSNTLKGHSLSISHNTESLQVGVSIVF